MISTVLIIINLNPHTKIGQLMSYDIKYRSNYLLEKIFISLMYSIKIIIN